MFENQPDEDIVIVDPLDTEAVTKGFATVSAQKKHWREKAIDPTTGKTYKELYEERIKTTAPQSTTPPEPINNGGDPEKKNVPSSSPDQEWIFDNIDAISSLAPDERAELRQTAKELNVDPIKFIKSKAGQAQLEKIRVEKKSQGATPTPSNQVPVFNGKPVADILRDPKASKEDKQRAYESRLRGLGSNQSI